MRVGREGGGRGEQDKQDMRGEMGRERRGRLHKRMLSYKTFQSIKAFIQYSPPHSSGPGCLFSWHTLWV